MNKDRQQEKVPNTVKKIGITQEIQMARDRHIFFPQSGLPDLDAIAEVFGLVPEDIGLTPDDAGLVARPRVRCGRNPNLKGRCL